MRSSLSIGVCVCLAALVGCGETADNGGTGNTPGSGGDNRGPGGESCSYTAESAVEAQGQNCSLNSVNGGRGDFVIQGVGTPDFPGGNLQLINVSGGSDVLPIEAGHVLTPENTVRPSRPPREQHRVGIEFKADNGDAYECESAEGDDPAIGTFRIEYLELGTDPTRIHVTIDATCPGPGGSVELRVEARKTF